MSLFEILYDALGYHLRGLILRDDCRRKYDRPEATLYRNPDDEVLQRDLTEFSIIGVMPQERLVIIQAYLNKTHNQSIDKLHLEHP